ncbi:MAG: LysR substrate-binding domain-containing protein [Lautropia sp.]
MSNPLDMVVFAKVVELKSFSAAASHLGMSRSAASKHVSRLEQSLGVRLLNRTTRHLDLTDAGQEILLHCARVAQEASASEVTASLFAARPAGTVRVSASGAFARLRIAPLIPALLAQYPDLDIEVVMTDRVVDLVRDRIDIAVTSDVLPGANLAVRPLVPIRSVVCASVDYLEANGIPEAPKDLARHNCLTYRSSVTMGKVWRFQRAGKDYTVEVDGNFRANNNEMLRNAAIDGLGIALVPAFVFGVDPREARLRTVLDGYEPLGLFDQQVSLHFLAGRRIPPRIRACIDFFVERVQQDEPPIWPVMSAKADQVRAPRYHRRQHRARRPG